MATRPCTTQGGLAECAGGVLELQLGLLEANIITFNATLSACGQGREWQRSLALLVEAQVGDMACGHGECRRLNSKSAP